MIALPVASRTQVRAHARRVALRQPRALAAALCLHGAAAVTGLVSPWLLGNLVEDVGHGIDKVTGIALLILVFILAQAMLLRTATYVSAKLGERVLADLREGFVGDVLALPLDTVEAAGSGDLITRTTRDVDSLSTMVRVAIPDFLVSASAIVITLGALFLVNPVLLLPGLIAVPVLAVAARWYLRRARAGYLRQNASYSEITEGFTETVQGARTVEGLRLSDRRYERALRDIAESNATERHTMWLRTVYLPICDTAFLLPVAATLIIGGLLYIDGSVDLASVTAATLYLHQLTGPVDVLLARMNDFQLGGAALARLLGVRRGGEAEPSATRCMASRG